MQLQYFLTIFVLSFMFSHAPQAQTSKILAVFPYPSKSHLMMNMPIIRDLIAKGHEVTTITPISLKSQNLGSNYTELLIPVYNFWDDVKKEFGAKSLFDLTNMNFFDFLSLTSLLGVVTTEHALQQPKVQELINMGPEESEQRFDLLLAEQFYQEAFLALAYKFKIPVVTISTMGYENYMSQMMGLITPWSFVPNGLMPFTDKMNYLERVQNTIYSLYEDMDREFRYFPKMDRLVEKYFSHLPVQIPSVSQMDKNISLILLNSYVPLTTPRPTTDNMIPVGGLHIYPPKQLPDDMLTFLDEAEHGVIYFSLGSNVQSKDMPLEKFNMFLEVFGGLKQRVLWKFENDSLPDLPANVMVKKWMPQSDILAHPNVKVFITHGGLFGTQEGVHYAVPMLGFPVYCDQHLNMNKAVQGGYGISLHFQSTTKDILRSALLELLQNPQYRHSVQRISRIFRDRPMSARDSAIYWIEYVIRHKGATHLRSAGMDLNWYQFYLLDVIALLGVALVLALSLVVLLMRFAFKSTKSKESKNKRE